MPVWILLLLAALIGGAAFITFYIAFLSVKRDLNPLDTPFGGCYAEHWDATRPLIEDIEQLPCEHVSIQSRDGLALHARYYHQADGAPLHIQFHGYRSMASRDFCGGHKLARQLGHNVLLVDQRAHGHSEGRVITFGIRERYDCLDWCRWAAQRHPDSRILLCGVSMGAATVLMASDLPLPQAVCGIMADSPYSTPSAIIRKVCVEDMHIPAWLGMPLLHIGAALYGHFRLGSASAIDSVRRARVPLLIMHGEADTFVPCEMAREIAAVSAAPVTVTTFPDADHAQGYLIHPQPYEEAFCRFVEEVLNNE